MLPYTLRDRRSGSNQSFPGVKMVMSDTANKIRRLPYKVQCFLISTCIISIYVYGGLIMSLKTNHLKTESFLETDKCPACFGHSICVVLKTERIQLTGWSKVRLLDIVNIKNVHTARHLDNGDQFCLSGCM
jgi:hypothetical protein